MEFTILVTILPIPAYSSTDPASGLSSTSWLLAQPEDFQRLHIPVPYEDPTCTHPHPPFPVPAGFCGPLEIGGWKNSKPSWVQAVPQVIEMSKTTTFRCFNPRVALSKDELWCVREYCRLHSPPVVSSGPPSFPLGHRLDRTYNGDSSAGASLALQSLYANDAVKHPFAHLDAYSRPLVDPQPDFDDSDSDDNWEDEMDPITFARYYAATSPHLAEIVRENDRIVRERLDQRVATGVL